MKPGRVVLYALLFSLLAFGGFAGVLQWLHGDAVTGLGTIGAGGVVWGLYVAGDGFFASVALASLTLGCLARLLRVRVLEPVAHLTLPLAVASLFASVFCVLADLGRPLDAMINLSLVGRAQAPFFSTFTLVAGAAFCASLIHLGLASRPSWAQPERARFWRVLACGWTASPAARHRRERVDFWLSLALLPLLVVGLVILGAVFCARSGRPVWLLRYELVTFMVSAAAAASSLLLVSLAARKQVNALLARMVAMLIALTVFLLILGQLLTLRSPGLALHRYTQALLAGPWSPLFWTELGFLFAAAAICLGRLWRGRLALAWTVMVAALVCTAVFLQRFLSLVAWQTHGQGLPWPAGVYHPTWVEWGVQLGIAAAGTLAWLWLLKACPRVALAPGSASHARDRARRWAAGICLFFGFVLADGGLVMSAGLGSAPFLDPVLTGSPLLFLGGLILMLSAALVYELYPEKTKRA